jgi:hypothetical protein
MIKWIVAISLLVPSIVWAGDTWYPANEKSFAWDPVTTLTDGTSITTGTIKYRLYLKDESTGNTIEMQEVEGPPASVTIEMDGKVRVGVKTLRYFEGELVSASENIAWSDDPAYVENGETFGFSSWQRPADSMNLRLPDTAEQK